MRPPKKFPLIVKSFVFFLLTITLSLTTYSQPPASEPTEQQMNEIIPEGITIDPTQMNQRNFQAYFEDKNKSETGTDKNKPKDDVKKEDKLEKDSVQKDYIRLSGYSPDQTYGANIFQNSAIYDIGELSTPPLDYPIGVGDHIVVALWGGGEYQEDYVVARDGTIFPAGLGKITVQGLTFEAARSIIYSRFKSVVPATTNVQVTLGQPRTINVNVAGEVANPGPVTVSAFSNVFNVIGLAGGISDFGNLRSVQIKRAGKVIETADVYQYLSSGDYGKHIYLQNNDFILVPFVEKTVLATGQFKRPMYYQLKTDEGLRALIKFSGGFTPDAFTSGVKIISTSGEKQVIRDVNATAILKLNDLDFPLADGDVIKAVLIKPGIANKVEIKGEVTYPGTYELRQNDRLFDVINRAGGITKNTYLARAYIFRGAGDSTVLKSDKLEINLSDFSKDNVNSENNVVLQSNDLIQLFSSSEFGDEQYVEIYGEIRKSEGKRRMYGGMTLQDLIYLSGGLKPSAEFGRLEISSIVDIDSAQKGLKPTRTIVKSYAIQQNLELDSAAAKVLLKPFDQIFVRKNPTFEMQENVTLAGLIKYPGSYPRLNKKERLSSYIERAGGIKENANLSGAVLFRSISNAKRDKLLNRTIQPKLDSLGNVIIDNDKLLAEAPVSIDLYRAMKNKNSKHDIVLEENDIVYIPEVNPFVTVQGKVQSPLRITYDKEHTKLSYYIDKAGGFGIRPWRKRIFVTYANGKSRRTRNLFFLHFYPKVEQGSIVTVPERPEGKELSDTVAQTVLTSIPKIISVIILRNIN